jgi:hypothetical protein
MLSLIFGATEQVTKSLVLIAGTYAVYKVLVHRDEFVAFLVTGPYATVTRHRLMMASQRAIINFTRVNREIKLYPLESIVPADNARKCDNGHPISGGTRDVARETISLALRAAGMRHYEISPAKQSPAEAMEHQHYAPADLARPIASDVIENHDIVVAIDIDYYLDDPGRYLGRGVPFIAYTFNPIDVAGPDGDSHFRIKDNNVNFDVSGGGKWSHKIWDWCNYGEFIETLDQGWPAWLLSWIGLRKVHVHKVHHARPWPSSPNRALVWCLPQVSYWRFACIPTDIHTRTLQRVTYHDATRPGWNSIVSVQGDALTISLGREDADHCIRIPKNHYDMLMGLSSAQSVTSRMIGLKFHDPSVMATFAQYYSGKEASVATPDRIGRPIQPKVHWPAHYEVDEAAVSSRAYATPLVNDENMLPMIKRWETLSLSLDRRVTMQRNDKHPSKRIRSYAIEFVNLVVPEHGVGVPHSLEDTAEMLNKPSQTLAIKQVWETVDMEPRRLIEAFVKNEPTMKAGRIISSFADMRYLLKFSTFTLAFRDQVLHAEHNAHWFCPGLTPVELSDKVVEYVRSVGRPSEGDYSNFDGSVSQWLQRHVMNALYLRYFNNRSRTELQSYTDMLISCPARAKRFGFAYEAGYGVKSGSPTTCDLNTCLNAFLQYTAVRMTTPELTPEEAFRSIGLAFGDDSLFEERFASNFSKASREVGMSLKVESYDPERGITFLARVFPDPFTTNTSFQDPLRTWRKLHLTSRDPNIPLSSAALDRVEGYLVTDRHTPLTSAYCTMVKRVYEAGGAEALPVRQLRKSSSREKPYWLTIGGAWPQDVADVDLMFRCAAARTGVDVETLRTRHQQLLESQDVWADISINRDEEPNSYRDTVDPEGPAEGAVDPRVIENDRQVMRSHADQATTTQNRRASEGGPRGATGPTRGGSQRQQGSSSVRGLLGRTPPESVPRDQQPAHQATRGRSVARGGAGPGGSRPWHPNKAATTTAAGSGKTVAACGQETRKFQAEGRSGVAGASSGPTKEK